MCSEKGSPVFQILQQKRGATANSFCITISQNSTIAFSQEAKSFITECPQDTFSPSELHISI